ncbi:MAG: dihydrofolate reductase family protein [Deinococcota bacterium]
MVTKCSVYIATSLDGFIARPDGDIEWLHRPEYSESEGLDPSYETFISTVDALVMGRHSFEKVLSFSDWPYKQHLVIVLTTKNLEIPEGLEGKVRFEQGHPDEILKRLESEGMQHLYIDGGITIQGFLKSGLIDELVIAYIPILLGEGIPLFTTLDAEQRLDHVDTTVAKSGIVQSVYKVVKT